jgi:hypothetical protein
LGLIQQQQQQQQLSFQMFQIGVMGLLPVGTTFMVHYAMRMTRLLHGKYHS